MPPGSPTPTNVSLLYALREAADAYDDRMTPVCEAAGLTLAQFNLLYLVVEEGPMSLGELAKNRRCVKSNVSYLVRSMEKDDLLALVADTGDRRVRHVRASPKGLKAFRTALRGAVQLQKEVSASLGEKATASLAERLMSVAHLFDRK
ncbi:MAG TPA: MarR family transcriptional regulator [Polyangiaceae bacterium]|nr:MarR family transcriptional regulator [Polyangiaceae bacterium]